MNFTLLLFELIRYNLFKSFTLGLLLFFEGWVVNELLFGVTRVCIILVLQIQLYEGAYIRSRLFPVLAPDLFDVPQDGVVVVFHFHEDSASAEQAVVVKTHAVEVVFDHFGRGPHVQVRGFFEAYIDVPT